MSKNAEIWEHVETNLIRYKPTGGYYVKAKIHGKKVRESLDTDKLLEARRLLVGWLSKVRTGASKGKTASTMKSLVEDYKIWLDGKIQAERTRQCRLDNLKVISKTWLNFEQAKISRVSRHDVQVWRDGMVNKFEYSHTQANQCLGTLRQMFRLAEDKGMLLHDAPTLGVKELPPNSKKVKLPTKEQFEELRKLVYKRSPAGGELFDFLALSGSRITASQSVTWGDVDWDKNTLIFEKAKKRPYTMPLTKSLKAFLLKIKRKDAKDTDRITKVDSIKKVLGNCCEKLKIPHLSHHALRKWFITRVIETNKVDPQTLSWWVGHHDGGVLLQKTYGQLRDEHSQELAKLI